MLVVEEKVLRAIVGNVDVVPAVIVEIRRRHAHRAPHIGADPRLVAHIGKRSVAVVVIELVRLALVVQRPRIIVRRVICAILGIELDVAADKQINAAVLVVIEPSGTDGPAVNIDACLFGYIGKVTIAVVVIEDRFSVAGDQQIDKAIIVVIGSGHGHSVDIWIEAGLLRYIGEVSVAIVAIEMIVRRRSGLHLERKWMHRVVERPSVDHIERLAAGVVVVKPDATGARAFEQRTQFARAEAVGEVDARLSGGVFKANHRRHLRCG